MAETAEEEYKVISLSFFKDWHEFAKKHKLSNQQYGAVIRAMCEYCFYSKDTKLDLPEALMFDMSKPFIRASNKRKRKGSEYGKKGRGKSGAPTGNTNASKKKLVMQTVDEPPQSLKDALILSELLLTLHRDELPEYLAGKDKSVIPKWAADIEKLIRIDKKSPEDIRQVIMWIKTPGNFWFNNIMSGDKLRKQFERLYGQMVSTPLSAEERKAQERERQKQDGIAAANRVIEEGRQRKAEIEADEAKGIVLGSLVKNLQEEIRKKQDG